MKINKEGIDMKKKLYKSRTDIKLDGVCAGIAEYFGIDSTLVRLIFVLLTFFPGPNIIAYIVCMLVIPREPDPNGPIDVQ